MRVLEKNMDNKLKNIIFDKSVIRFVIVGFFCTSIDFSIYMFIVEYVDVIIGKGISMVCSIIINYFLNKFWSFSANKVYDKTELARYIGTQIINISTNVFVNAIVLQVFNMKIVAFICATGIAMVINYLLQRFWVFKKRNL